MTWKEWDFIIGSIEFLLSSFHFITNVTQYICSRVSRINNIFNLFICVSRHNIVFAIILSYSALIKLSLNCFCQKQTYQAGPTRKSWGKTLFLITDPCPPHFHSCWNISSIELSVCLTKIKFSYKINVSTSNSNKSCI